MAQEPLSGPEDWLCRVADSGAISALAQQLAVRELTARLLVCRGVADARAAQRFLKPQLSDLRPPAGISDLDGALGRLKHALVESETIGVFGDYDVDGVTSAAVLVTGLRALGARVEVRVAHRFAGYGFTSEAADWFAQKGCQVVVMADCGTSDHASIERLSKAGIDSVVIDHHQVPSGDHPALALINPHRADDQFEFKGLCSCGLAFYMVAALRSRLRAEGWPAAVSFDPRSLLDLVALGTIADVVPLVEENRILVATGLRVMAKTVRPGLRALMQICQVDPKIGIDTSHVGFRLGPRLNAAGRLGDAGLALDVLLAATKEDGEKAAAVLDEKNQERRKIQSAVEQAAEEQAKEILNADPAVAALVVAGHGWHPGVLGIVAARLAESHARPALVIGFEGDTGRGSGRSHGGFNLYDALASSREHLIAFGGHAAAAGLSLKPDAFEAFRADFLAASAGWAAVGPKKQIEVDAEVSVEQLDPEGIAQLCRVGPFGCENEPPLVGLRGVTVVSRRLLGNDHVLVTLSQGSATVDAIGFGLAGRLNSRGQICDVAGHPEIDCYRGVRRPRLRLTKVFDPSGRSPLQGTPA